MSLYEESLSQFPEVPHLHVLSIDRHTLFKGFEHKTDLIVECLDAHGNVITTDGCSECIHYKTMPTRLSHQWRMVAYIKTMNYQKIPIRFIAVHHAGKTPLFKTIV